MSIRERFERMGAFFQRHARLFFVLRVLAALGGGVASVLLLRRGVSFAPAAAASVLFAWMLVVVVARYLPADEKATRLRRLARFLATGFVAGLYQDVLFFLVPIWGGSATWPSLNIVAPLLLAGMALFTCFEDRYMDMMLAHPVYRAGFSALVLFATLVAATPVLVTAPLRPSLAISAVVSAGLAGVAALPPRGQVRRGRALLGIALGGALAAAFFIVTAPALPPVPVSLVKATTALAVRDREPESIADVFPAGTPRVYAHFSVASPPKFSEHVRFHWVHDGQPLSKEFQTTITGGRKTGFRTFGYVSNPAPGAWVVELLAESGQLIGRARFRVE